MSASCYQTIMAHENFSVLGGGIAGLAAAIALARTGHSVTILEKAKAFDPIGAGIQLGPNAVRALQKIGAWEAVQPITYAPPAIHFRSGTSGRLLKELKLGSAFENRFGQPYRVAHRADLHARLLAVAESLPQIKIEMNASAAPQDIKGRVIAADGMWSKTREQLFPGTRAVSDPSVIFRAMIAMPEQNDIAFTCVNLWYYPGAHVVHYPAGRKDKLNLVFIGPPAGPCRHLAKSAPQLRHLVARVPSWKEWQPAYVTPLPSWHKHNTLLIGDAAHGTLPYLAQGAAMSLEDGAALLLTTNPQEFEALRLQRCTRLHQQTLQVGKIDHFGGVKAFARNTALRFSSDETVLGRMSWIYSG